MCTRVLALACGLLLACGSLFAQGQCGQEGERGFRYGWGMVVNPGGQEVIIPPPGKYNLVAVNGPDTTWGPAGGTLKYRVGPYNCTAWLPGLCTGQDTLCYDISSEHGWTFVCDPPAGTPQVLPAGGYLWYQVVTIQIPCNATIGSYERVIGTCAYTDFAGNCDPSCPDCADPNIRVANHTAFYSSDTLYVRVDMPQPESPPVILRDTLLLVGNGQSAAYIPFSLCNQDPCVSRDFGYHIWSLGHIGPPISVTDTVQVVSGKCSKVYGIIDASYANPCTYDTLRMIAWSCAPVPLYDTSAIRVHVVDGCCAPTLTGPMLAFLVLALVFAAAILMRRRATSRP